MQRRRAGIDRAQVLAAFHRFRGGEGIAPAQQLGPFAPGTRIEVAAVNMLAVGPASHQRVLRLFQGPLPTQGIRAQIRVAMSVLKASDKKMLQRRMQYSKGWRGRLGSVRHSGITRMEKMTGQNALFVRGRVSFSLERTRKRMRSFPITRAIKKPATVRMVSVVWSRSVGQAIEICPWDAMGSDGGLASMTRSLQTRSTLGLCQILAAKELT